MPSYYDVLRLESNATLDVIESAIDEQYKQYRGLINHHDPNVVEQTNRALRQLEEIRSTLADPEKRALYDQTISFGGLADPTAILQASNSNLVTPPPQPQVSLSDATDVNAWKCEQCGKSNRVGSKTCSNCGNVLARDCPNLCGNVVLLSEKYCSNCGKSVEEGLATLQIEFERHQSEFVEGLLQTIRTKQREIDRLSWFSSHIPMFGINAELNELLDENVFTTMVISKPRLKEIIEKAIVQRREYIRHAERRLQEEQGKTFEPLLPRRYSPATN